MQELDEREGLRKPGAVMDRNLDLANIGKHARGLDRSFPSEVGELAVERRFEIACGGAEIRKSLELRLRHYGLRKHRGSRRLLSANDRLHALMLQPQQPEQRDAENGYRDHHLDQSKRARAPAKKIHRGIPDGITSPAMIATWPVSGEISSVITSPDWSSRCTTVA